MSSDSIILLYIQNFLYGAYEVVTAALTTGRGGGLFVNFQGL